MSNLYKSGKISLREARDLALLKARSRNKAFTKASRREAKRVYKERVKGYSKR